MTFDSRERSLASGQPVRLYAFARGALRWAYCTADRAIVFQGQTFLPVAISDDGIRLTGESSAEVLTVTASAALEVAQLYRVTPPSAEVELVVRDYHYGEADAPSSATVKWAGSVTGVRWPQVDRCEIACESVGASMERPGLRLTWERNCPHTVYDRNCRVERLGFAVPATLSGVGGLTIDAAAFDAQPDGYFAGGFVEWAAGAGELERRGVETHLGATLTMLGGTYGLAVGQEVTAYPGCRQTKAYCNGTFNNIANYGGFDLPGKSPFDGDPIF